MSSLKRLAIALQCPFSEEINLSSSSHRVKLVAWLEDRIVRELEIDERVSLRIDSSDWDGNFNSYLEKLGCPFSWPSCTDSDIKEEVCDCFHWLLSYAVSIAYEEEAEEEALVEEEEPVADRMSIADTDLSECANADTELNAGAEACQENSNMMASDAIVSDSITDAQSILRKVHAIAESMGVTYSDCDLATDILRKICQKVKYFLLPVAAGDQLVQKIPPLDQFPLGFDTQDDAVNKVALVLRMLYLSDFRELQTDVNDLLVLGQEYTANPRLNSALGKVGR